MKTWWRGVGEGRVLGEQTKCERRGEQSRAQNRVRKRSRCTKINTNSTHTTNNHVATVCCPATLLECVDFASAGISRQLRMDLTSDTKAQFECTALKLHSRAIDPRHPIRSAINPHGRSSIRSHSLQT